MSPVSLKVVPCSSAFRASSLAMTLGLAGISKSQVSALAKTLDSEVAAFRSRPGMMESAGMT